MSYTRCPYCGAPVDKIYERPSDVAGIQDWSCLTCHDAWSDNTVWLLYRNHRGEVAWRECTPLHLFFGESPAHSEKQWLLDAFAQDRQALRTFAMRDVLCWRTEGPGAPPVTADGTLWATELSRRDNPAYLGLIGDNGTDDHQLSQDVW